MNDREELTALLMAGAVDCLGKGGTLNCSKLADYLIEHGVIVLPLEKTAFLTREEAEKALKEVKK